MSRLEALNYCNTIQNEPSAIISISTPHNDYEYSVFKSKTNMVTDILELCFSMQMNREASILQMIMLLQESL